MKIKFSDLWSNQKYESVVSEILYNVAIVLQQFNAKIDKLEKRVASLESKCQETDFNRSIIDSEGDDATKVPNKENEINTERLK